MVEQFDDSVSYTQVLVVKEVRVAYNYGIKAKAVFFTVGIKLHYNPSLKEAGTDNLLMETI